MSDEPHNASQDRRDAELAATQEHRATDVLATTPLLEESRQDVLSRSESRQYDIPGYEITAELGRGGMGLVLQGRDGEIGRDVAVKVLLERHRDRPELAQRFVEEARINGQLQHPGIVPVYELGRFADERPYFAMKLVEGRTLAELLKERKGPADDRTKFIKIFEQVCQTLAYAHARRVIHRDLKPHNIMVGAFGEVQVMDWGLGKMLAREAVDEARETASERRTTAPPRTDIANERVATIGRIGTPAYMPPEQALGEMRQVDERSDVFGLGAILCEILTGRPPFLKAHIEPQHEDLHGELSKTFTRLEACGADVELIALAKRSLAADPADRPRDAGVLAGEVTAYLESVEARLRRAELDRAAAEVEAREQRRRRKLTLGLAAAVVVVFALLGGGAFWLQSQYADTERNVEAALAKAEQSHAQFRQMLVASAQEAEAALVTLRQAQAAAREARSVLDTGVTSDDLNQRVADLSTDIDQQLGRLEREAKLFRDLDAARMATLVMIPQEGSGVRPIERPGLHSSSAVTFDFAGSIRRYESAFADYGLRLRAADRESVVAQLRGQRKEIRDALIVALDDWAFAAYCLKSTAPASSRELSDLAHAVDENPLRKRIRLASLDNDIAQLEAAAREAFQSPQTPSTLEQLALSLESVGRGDEAMALLRRARIQYASDYWIHVTLASLLTTKRDRTDSELQEAIGCYSAAIALRPDAEFAFNGLGFFLAKKNDTEGAIAAYRQALAIDPRYADSHYNLGISLANRNDLEAAVAAYKVAIEINPGFAPAHHNLGIALAARKDVDAAIAAYRQAIEINPRFTEAHVNLGNALRAKNDFDGAITAYETAVEIDPGYALARANLGFELERRNDLNAAIAAYRAAVELEPASAGYYLQLGTALRKTSDLDGAVSAYNKAIELAPTNARAHFQRGVALRSTNDFEGAIAAYKAALEINPQEAEVWVNLGEALLARNNVEGAIAACRKTLDINPRHAVAHMNLGIALSERNEFDAAIVAFKTAIDINPRDALAHYNFGNALKAKRDLDGAIAAYRDAIAIDPGHARAHTNLGVALAALDDLDGAIAEYRRAIEIDPRLYEAHCNLGRSLWKRKDLVGAIAAFRAAIAVNPRLPDAHDELGNALAAVSDLDGAIAAFQAGVDANPQLAAAHYNLGTQLMKKNDLDGAMAAYRKAIEIRPRFIAAQFSLGDALKDKGDLDGALAAFKTVTEIDPQHAGAHLWLGLVLTKKQDLRGAIAEFETAIGIDPRNVDAHYNLGALHFRLGEFAAARNDMQSCLDHSAKDDRRLQLVNTRIRELDRLIALEAKLAQVLSGESSPADNAQRLAFIEVCQPQRRYSKAVRFYEEAFADDPRLADRATGRRYNAACCAALAGCGQGIDAKELNQDERGKLRRQAVDWLRSELAAWVQRLERSTGEERRIVEATMQHWLNDADLAGVRDSEQLSNLPAEEQPACRQLWANVRMLHERAATESEPVEAP